VDLIKSPLSKKLDRISRFSHVCTQFDI
jgi:hypothetical protein